MGGSSGGSSGGGTQRTITTPWEGQQPYLKDLFSRAQQLVDAGPPQYYPGQEVAAPSDFTEEAQQNLVQQARTTLPQQAEQARAAQQQLFQATDVTRNPALAAAAEGAIRPVEQALMERILPGIRSGAIQAGGVGGSREGIAQSQGIRDATQSMIDRTAQMYSQAYGQGLDAQARGLALAPQTAKLAFLPGQALSAVGQQEQTYEQQLLDAARRKFEFEQQAPYQQLAQYQNLIQGGYGGTTTTNLPSQGGGSDLLTGLGGALQGYSGLQMLGAMGAEGGALSGLAASTPVGWAAAGLGALAALS